MNRKNLIKNIGIIAHIDCGKTTLTEKMLNISGFKKQAGEVHDGNTTTDHLKVERERGITVTASCISVNWKDCMINIVDTPGHPDFGAEVDKALRVLDSVVLLLSAKEGIQAQTENIWYKKEQHKVPSIIFVNKMDREGADFYRVVDSIEEKFSGKIFLILDFPIGKEKDFQGFYSLVDDKAFIYDLNKKDYQYTTKTFEEIQHLFDDREKQIIAEHKFLFSEYREELNELILNNQIVLISCGTALKNIGIDNLLNHIISFMPSPEDFKNNLADKHGQPLNHDIFTGLVFKTSIDKFFGHLSAVRIYTGSIKRGDTINVSTKNTKERISRIVRIMADKVVDLEDAFMGDIVGVIGCRSAETRDTLCDVRENIELETIDFAEPLISQALELVNSSDHEKLTKALIAFSKEEGSFGYEIDPVTNQTILHGMGDLHLDVIATRMKETFNIDFTLKEPKVKYHEAITREVLHFGDNLKHVKQTGGRGEYAHIVINVKPHEGERFKFVNYITGGKIPTNFISTVEKTLGACMENGILTNSPLYGIQVELLDGSYHDVDSSDRAFATCTSNVFKKALEHCKSIILEPIMEMNIISPNEYTGKITADLLSSKKRGTIISLENDAKFSQIVVLIPLINTFNYISSLRSLSSGRAFLDYQVHNSYKSVPDYIQEEIIKNSIM